jgi:hypothetical protein
MSRLSVLRELDGEFREILDQVYQRMETTILSRPNYVDLLVHLTKEAHVELGAPSTPCNLFLRRDDIVHFDAMKEKLPFINMALSVESDHANIYPQLRYAHTVYCKDMVDLYWRVQMAA